MIFILPTFNHLDGLKHFTKIMSQENRVIVCDNSKGDEIKNYCLQFTNIMYLKNHPKTPIDNWNSGLRHVEEDFVIILHDDEYLDKIDLISFKERIKETDCIYLLQYQVQKNKKKINLTFSPFIQNLFLKMFPSLFLFINFIGPTGAYIYFYRSKDQIFYDKNLNWLVDMDFFYRISKKKKFIFLPLTVTTQVKNHSISSNMKNTKYIIEIKELWYLKKKYQIHLIKFILYFLLAFFIRLIKKLFNLFV